MNNYNVSNENQCRIIRYKIMSVKISPMSFSYKYAVDFIDVSEHRDVWKHRFIWDPI